MPSLFSVPTYAPGASLPPRAVQELDKTPPAQSRDAASGDAYGAASQGAGAPAATAAVAEATPLFPQPAPTPPVSASQAGRLTQMVIAQQAKTEAVETDKIEAKEEDAEAAAVGANADPVGTDQESEAIREQRKEVRVGDEVAEALANEPKELDPARAAAEKYRDANETTSAAEPARLLMDA